MNNEHSQVSHFKTSAGSTEMASLAERQRHLIPYPVLSYPDLKNPPWFIPPSPLNLCGVCMFSPCSQGASSTKNPNRKKHAKKENTLRPSLTKTDGSPHLVPGRLKSCPLLLGSWRKDSPGWEKAETKFTNDLRPACACVCVLCRLHVFTCVLQCVACANKV